MAVNLRDESVGMSYYKGEELAMFVVDLRGGVYVINAHVTGESRLAQQSVCPPRRLPHIRLTEEDILLNQIGAALLVVSLLNRVWFRV
jgi:hypothetical protein